MLSYFRLSFRYLRFLLRVLWHTHRLYTRRDPKSAVWLFGRLCYGVRTAYQSALPGHAPRITSRLYGALEDAENTFLSLYFSPEEVHNCKESLHASFSGSRPARPE